jgi:multiple sugar transport system permease protein
MILSHHARRRLGDLGVWLLGLLITLFAIFPIVWALLTSLKREAAIITTVMQYIPREVTSRTMSRSGPARTSRPCSSTAWS